MSPIEVFHKDHREKINEYYRKMLEKATDQWLAQPPTLLTSDAFGTKLTWNNEVFQVPSCHESLADTGLVQEGDPDGPLVPLPSKSVQPRVISVPTHNFIAALYKPYEPPC